MENLDINDVFEDIFLSENRISEEAYKEGFEKGKQEGHPEAFHLGYHRGAELGAELGFYHGVLKTYLQQHEQSTNKHITNIHHVINLIENFPKTNEEHFDILGQTETIRAQYKKICSLLKIDGKFTENKNLSF